MRTLPALAALVAVAALSPVLAQTYPDGGRMLIDPATGQQRYVPPLLEPWQSQPVRLHPPRKHMAHKSTSMAAAPETTSDSSAPAATDSAPPAPRRHKAKPTATASAAPQRTEPARQAAAPTQQSAGTFSGGSDFTDLISPQQAAPAPPPARKKVAAMPPPKPVERAKSVETPRVSEPPPPPVERPVQKASVEPSRPVRARTPTGARKDTITFAPNASDPSTTAVSTVRSLAGTLNSALTDSNARVQLMAYGGMRGEKSSDTRRLSLKRALVIRQLLIDDGVPAERIDVFALGGVDDDGPLDRVDVFVKS